MTPAERRLIRIGRAVDDARVVYGQSWTEVHGNGTVCCVVAGLLETLRAAGEEAS